MFTRHVALSIFAFFASQASVAQAFPSSPPSGSYSERLDGRDTSGVGKRTPEIPIDSIKFVDAKDLKIIGKRTPDIPLDRVTWVDAQAVPDITARQSGYTSVNNALLDFMEGDLDIPLYCLAVSVGGKELVLSYENKVNTLLACCIYVSLISLFRMTELVAWNQ